MSSFERFQKWTANCPRCDLSTGEIKAFRWQRMGEHIRAPTTEIEAHRTHAARAISVLCAHDGAMAMVSWGALTKVARPLQEVWCNAI